MSTRRWLAGIGMVAFAATSYGATSAGSRPTASPAELAITSFNTRPTRLESSFGRLNEAAFNSPDDLRVAALAHRGDSNAERRYAAVYGLALTAAAGPSVDALSGLLRSPNLTERNLAAAKLVSIGAKQGLPVLIAQLGPGGDLSYWEETEPLWQLARAVLLDYTDRDFGLRNAKTGFAAERTKKAWRRWWARYGRALRWDPAKQEFITGAVSSIHQQRMVRRTESVPARRSAAAGVGTQVTQSGNVVTLTVPLDVYAPEFVHNQNGVLTPSSMLAQLWKAANEARWNAAFRRLHYRGCTGGIEFRLKVDLRVLPLSLRPGGGDDGRHQVVMADGPYFRSTNRSKSGTDGPTQNGHDGAAFFSSTSTSVWWSGATIATIGHEFAHLMGLGDDYVDSKQTNGTTVSIPLKGREGTYMAESSKPNIDQALVDRLGNLLKNAGRLKCTKPKPKPKAKPKGKPNRWYGTITYVFSQHTVDYTGTLREQHDETTTTVIPKTDQALWYGKLKITDTGPCVGSPGTSTITTTGSGSGKERPTGFVTLDYQAHTYFVQSGSGEIKATKVSQGCPSNEPPSTFDYGLLYDQSQPRRFSPKTTTLSGSYQDNEPDFGKEWTITWSLHRNPAAK